MNTNHHQHHLVQHQDKHQHYQQPQHAPPGDDAAQEGTEHADEHDDDGELAAVDESEDTPLPLPCPYSSAPLPSVRSRSRYCLATSLQNICSRRTVGLFFRHVDRWYSRTSRSSHSSPRLAAARRCSLPTTLRLATGTGTGSPGFR